MKTYELIDGGTIAAASHADILAELRRSSKFDNDVSDEQYMYDFAKRYETQTGSVLSFSDAGSFIAELFRVEFIKLKS